ncbi:MAG: hypothetical protein ACJ8BW_37800 [Ktedonobacteraceae bacterium]
MNLEQDLHTFQQKYVNLEQQAEHGSIKRHVYNQIVTFINGNQHVTPAKQRAFETQISLVSLAKVLDPPSERHVVWEAVKELEQIADLHPLR